MLEEFPELLKKFIDKYLKEEINPSTEEVEDVSEVNGPTVDENTGTATAC